jgi:hypothetical protein
MINQLIKPDSVTNTDKGVEKFPQKKGSKGKTAKQIVNRHISNKDDVITEEEFKNLEVGVGENATSGTTHIPLKISNDPDRPKDEDKDQKIITPWDVIK